jgi:microcompartment protein CcmK/EutM
MKLGKIIGNVVSTNKVDNVNSLKLYVVEYLNEELIGANKSAVCADTMNAGIGDIVLVCSSSSARMTRMTKDACIDNTIVAIVDIISSGQREVYNKGRLESDYS